MRPSQEATERTNKRLTRRTAILLAGQTALVGVLGWRMRDLGVVQSHDFRAMADDNRINIRLIPPVRGQIYDRQGQPLAINIPSYKLNIVKEQAGDIDVVLDRLRALVYIDPEDIDRAKSEMSKRRAFVPVTLATGLTWDDIAKVSANAPALPGILPAVGWTRQYPKANDYSHIIGYVGPVSDYDLSRLDDKAPLLLIPRFQIGKNGVENKGEKLLRGTAGVQRIEVNSVGRVIRQLDREEGEAGKNIQVTINSHLQQVALDRLGDQSSAAVLMDVTSGDVLALASAPTFDPNKFVTGISVPDWKSLTENKYRPLANKTVSGAYPPGSTFKMVVALAGLEAGVIDPQETIRCKGFIELHGRKFHCWKRGGHGNVNMVRSLRESCDVYYYELAQRVGIERITLMARKLGIGVRPDLPLPAVHKGLTPTKAWKQKVKGKDWVIGDSLNAGIGQGFVLATPLQLALMAARLGSGTQIEPRLLNVVGDQVEPVIGRIPLDIDPAHLDIVRRGMFEVVNAPRGTAGRSKITGKGRQMAGKTGTSQVRFITKAERAKGVIRNEDLPWERRDHALFVAYAPYDNPKFAVSVVVEHGGGGSKVAAPIAKDILVAALDLDSTAYGALPTRSQTRTGSQTDANLSIGVLKIDDIA